jgi:hypothetical protein
MIPTTVIPRIDDVAAGGVLFAVEQQESSFLLALFLLGLFTVVSYVLSQRDNST